MLGADAAAGGAATLAVVLVFHRDAFDLINAVDAEQTEVEALHAVGATAVIDDRIPAALGGSYQILGREARLNRCDRLILAQVTAELHHRRIALDPLGELCLAAL